MNRKLYNIVTALTASIALFILALGLELVGNPQGVMPVPQLQVAVIHQAMRSAEPSSVSTSAATSGNAGTARLSSRRLMAMPYFSFAPRG